MKDTSKYSSILRKALWFNAGFSALSAAECLFGSGMVSRFVGLPQAEVFALGINLAFFAAFVAFLATRRDLGARWVRGAVLAVIVMDVLWVVGSAAVLLAPAVQLTTAGKWTVGIVALAVADFATFQFIGWRGLRPGTSRTAATAPVGGSVEAA